MEKLTYWLVILMSGVQMYFIAFTKAGRNLASVTSLAIAFVTLALLIRIFYVEKRLERLQDEKCRNIKRSNRK
jgi:hypothetical protein